MNSAVAGTIKTNLKFKTPYPLYVDVVSMLNRFHNLHFTIDKHNKALTSASTEIEKSQINKMLLECDYILNVLEDYDV